MNRTRHDLLRTVRSILVRSDFTYCEIRGMEENTFDTVARRGNQLILVRVVKQRSDASKIGCNNLKLMGSVLRASPLLVAPSSSRGDLQDGVLYLRFGIPLMTYNTLHDHLIEDVPPLVFHGPGGHYVSLHGTKIRNRREILGFSLGALADAAGVSRKAIQMYESGMGSTVGIGLKLEEILGEQLIEPLDPFSYSEELQKIRDSLDGMEGIKKRVFDHLGSIGMEVIPTISCPFDALAISSESRLLASVEMTLSSVKDRSETLSGISRMTGSRSVIIVGGKPRDKNLGGTAVLTVSEVEKSTDPDEVIKMVNDRSEDV